jgi:hypothetical protein
MKMKDSEWSRNGKGDKSRTKTWEKAWQENYDEIDWSSHRKKKKNFDRDKRKNKV